MVVDVELARAHDPALAMLRLLCRVAGQNSSRRPEPTALASSDCRRSARSAHTHYFRDRDRSDMPLIVDDRRARPGRRPRMMAESDDANGFHQDPPHRRHRRPGRRLVIASTVLSFIEARSTATTERSAALARSLRNSTAAMKAIGDAVRTYADSVSRRPDILAALAKCGPVRIAHSHDRRIWRGQPGERRDQHRRGHRRQGHRGRARPQPPAPRATTSRSCPRSPRRSPGRRWWS